MVKVGQRIKIVKKHTPAGGFTVGNLYTVTAVFLESRTVKLGTVSCTKDLTVLGDYGQQYEIYSGEYEVVNRRNLPDWF
mgnify:CR=1 FL=1